MARVTTLIYKATGRKRPRSTSTGGTTNPTPQDIRPPLLSDGDTLYAPSIVRANVILAPLLSDGDTFYSPVIVNSASLSPPILTNTQTFYGPKINLRLVSGWVNNTNSIYGPVVSGNTLIVVPALTNAQTFYGPQLNLKVVAPLLSDGDTLYGPVLSLNTGQIVNAPLLSNTVTLYGTTNVKRYIRPNLLTNTNGFLPLTVSNGTLPFALSSTQAEFQDDYVAGGAPRVNLTLGSDIYEGYFLRVQRTQTFSGGQPVWTGILPLDLLHMVTSQERQDGTIDDAALAVDGYSYPPLNVLYSQRYRWERADGAIGPWSVISDTVTSSIAVWATSLENKANNLTISSPFLTALNTGNEGAPAGVRAASFGSSKGHFEITIGAYGATSGKIGIGLVDGTTPLGPRTYPYPGQTIPGASMFITKASASAVIFANADGNGYPMTAELNIGDKIICEYDTTLSGNTATQVRFYVWRVGGSPAQVGPSFTLTGSNRPAQPYAYGGAIFPNDQFTANFGGSSFSMTPTAGYGIYG